MNITKTSKFQRLADHLAYCHAAAERGRHAALAYCLV